LSALPAAPESAEPASSSDAPWVVCLCAEWCGTCRDYRPLLEQVARAHPQFRFGWVDIEDHAEIADAFDVETFPTLAGRRCRRHTLPGPAAAACRNAVAHAVGAAGAAAVELRRRPAASRAQQKAAVFSV
jgi:thiol-disulfide isomerase/thioredoxin